MKKTITLLFVLAIAATAYCQTPKWSTVNNLYNVGDYSAMKRVLDTVSITSNRDSVLWYNWMGEYYYWLSYEKRPAGDQARRCFERAIRLGAEKHVSDMPYGYCYLHLGELEYLYGEYDRAIKTLNRALTEFPYKAKRSYLQGKNPSAVYKGLGMCYAMKGDYDRALTYLDSCREQESGALSVVRMRGKVLALKGDKAESRKCYEQFVGRIREEVRDSFLRLDERHRETWWMSVRPFIADCWRLEGDACPLLYDVALLGKGLLLQENDALGYTNSDVRNAMRDGEVAIEWMSYERDGKRRLGAVVMRKNGDMRFVETGLEETINGWAYDEDDAFVDSKAQNTVWSKAMIEAIGDAKSIYFATDGALNQIGIEYMYPDKTRKLYRLTSTRELIKRRAADGQAAAAIMGGMDYDAKMAGPDYEAKAADATRSFNDDMAYSHLKSLKVKASYLKGAKPECDSILAIRHNAGDTLITGKGATERGFREVAGRYQVLHLSTHGYCRTKQRFESSDFPRREMVDRSLSESGLLFSGVNYQLGSRDGQYDGIVSAKELSAMDMRKVDVCVVSACEGSRGRVSVDGTYGIQRGLKAAGVGGMVLSLWEVDDKASTLFMESFFRHMADGMTVHDAFYAARATLQQVPEFNKPRFYNGFILIDIV